MNPLRALIISTLLALLTGCANLPSGEPSQELANKINGVVAASVTFKKDTQTNNTWYYIRKKGEADKDKFIRLSAVKPFSTGLENLGSLPFIGGGSSTFANRPDREGRVLAVSVEPGEYELYSWQLYIHLFNGYGYITHNVPPKPLTFMVKPGEVIYLGSLHGETIMGRNVFGLPVPGSGAPEIRDEYERDIPMLKARFPMLSDWLITSAKLDGQSWQLP